MSTTGTYFELLGDYERQHIYRMLYNQVLTELVPMIIRRKKAQIFSKIWMDPYFHAIMADGNLIDIIIDKDTDIISDRREDQEYFFIVNTTFPRDNQKSRTVTTFMGLVEIFNKYGLCNPYGIADMDADPYRHCYSFSIPILFE